MGSRRTPLCVLALCALVGGFRPTEAGAQVCGNGIVEGNEICDGQECCTAACTIAPNGAPCGAPAGPCQLASACFDFTCFEGDTLPDGTPCDDGDPCTVGETCRSLACVPQSRRCTVGVEPTITPANTLFRGVPGSVAVTVDCNVPGGAGGACSAAAFLPSPPATGAPDTAPATASQSDLACDFTRQITRSASRPLDDAGTARLKLKLNKLARRLIRKLPTSDMISLTVCTKIDFPNGDSVTLVDVVNAARQ